MKTLSRKPFILMLSDDSGEVSPVQLDVGLVNADHALIVLDEYNDTCWVWIGRNVSMPTRMHATRMARGIHKSGYKIGVTTIGLASGKLVEMNEKDNSDSEVASKIMAFKSVLDYKWSFDDKVLAYKKDIAMGSTEPIAGSPIKRKEPEPEQTLRTHTVREQPVQQKYTPPKAQPTPTSSQESTVTSADKKAGYLMMAIIKNSDIVYTEKIERSGKTGMKVEVPGVMVIEVLLQGHEISITPGDFGGSEAAMKIKSEFTRMVKTL